MVTKLTDDLRRRLRELPPPKVGDRVRVYDLRDGAVIAIGRVQEMHETDLPSPTGYVRKTLVSIEGLIASIPVGCCEVIE